MCLMAAATVHRTARIGLRTTPGQRRRCFGLLRSGGDVRAWLLECNRALREWGMRPVTNYQALCRELAGCRFGELDVVGARSVLRRYATEWHTAAKRRHAGHRVGFPRRKRALVPLRYYHGTFTIDGRRLRLPTARGHSPLWVRLNRTIPYPAETIRCVTLFVDAGRLVVDVTAELPVQDSSGDRGRVAGVDLGIIFPYAVAAGDEALLVSGRQLRAEERLHLADTKARGTKMGRKAPRRGQRGSRRWRKLRAAQRRAEARHRRRVRHAHHHAAKEVVAWARQRGIGTLVIGDPAGITNRNVGRRHNLRLRQWRRTHLMAALADKAELAGIEVVTVDERGTSSHCPACRRPVPKPTGRVFSCPHCGLQGHRDIVGARNIAARGGGSTTDPSVVTHRRAGTPPARRDRRRHLLDTRRSCLARGHPGYSGSRSPRRKPRDGTAVAMNPHAGSPAPDENPNTIAPNQGKGSWTEH